MTPLWRALLMATCVLAFMPGRATAAVDGAGGPIARAIAREGVRLALDAQSIPPPGSRAASASPSRGWSRLVRLNPGRELLIRTMGSALESVRLLTSDETSVTVVRRGDLHQPITIGRADIAEIRIWTRHEVRNVWIGALAGGVTLGTAYGRAEERSFGCRLQLYDSCHPGQSTWIGLQVGGLLGGAAGGVVALAQGRHTDRIYDAR